MEFSEVLPLCAELILSALQRGDGNIIAFLPGMKDILELKKSLREIVGKAGGRPQYVCHMLHSDVLDEHEEQQVELGAAAGPLVLLASSVAARAVTLPDIKYVVIHPNTRGSVLHALVSCS